MLGLPGGQRERDVPRGQSGSDHAAVSVYTGVESRYDRLMRSSPREDLLPWVLGAACCAGVACSEGAWIARGAPSPSATPVEGAAVVRPEPPPPVTAVAAPSNAIT